MRTKSNEEIKETINILDNNGIDADKLLECLSSTIIMTKEVLEQRKKYYNLIKENINFEYKCSDSEEDNYSRTGR